MIKREILFDRLWSQLQDEGASSDAVIDRALPVGLEGYLSVAAALSSYGRSAPPVDLDRAWRSLSARLEVLPQARGLARPVRTRASRARWSLRLAAAAAAAVVALAAVARQALPGSTLYPVRLTMEKVALAFVPNSGSLHLRIAEARLQDLIVTLRDGPATEAPGVARGLVANRSAARAEGADVSRLDSAIASEVPPALGSVVASIAGQVRAILGTLLPPAAPVPSASSPLAGGTGAEGIGAWQREAPERDEGAPGEHGDGGSGGNEGDQRGSGSDGSEGSGSGGSGDGSGEGSSPQSPGSGDGSGSEGPGSGGGGGSDEGSQGSGSGGPSGD